MSPERRAQIDAMLQQRRTAQPTGMTPERRAEIDAMLAQRTAQPAGPTGALGVASGFGKTIIDAPRQFAESGSSIGKKLSDSAFGQFFQRNVTAPLVGLLAPDQQKRLGQVANAGQQIVGASTAPVEALQRRTDAEKLGETAANVGMLLAPGGIAKQGAAALAPKLPQLGRFAQPVARGIAEGVSGAGITAGQTGDLGQAAKGGALDFAITGGLGALGKGISAATEGRKLSLPGQSVDIATKNAARRLGVNLPASSLTENNFVKLVEQNAASGIGGKGFTKKVDDAVRVINGFADDLVKKAGRVTSPEEAGKIISGGLDSFRKGFINAKEELYQAARIDKGMGTLIPQDSVDFIRPIMDDLISAAEAGGDVPQLAFWTKKLAGLTGQTFKNGDIADARKILKNSLRPAAIDLSAVRALIRDLNQRAVFNDVIQTGDKAALARFTATLSDEFDTALAAAQPEIAEALTKANAAYRRGLDFMQQPAATSVNRLADTPSKIYAAVARPTTSVEEVRQLLKLAGNSANDIRASVLDEVIRKSRRGGEIRGTVLETTLRNYGPEKLRAMFTPEQIQALQDLSNVAKALEGGQKIVKGSQTAFSNRITAYLTSAFFNPLIAIKLAVADGIFGKAVLSEQGQRALLEGIKIEPFGEAIGGRLQKIAPTLGAFGTGALNASSEASRTPRQ